MSLISLPRLRCGLALRSAALLILSLASLQANAVVADSFWPADIVDYPGTFVQSVALQPDGNVLVGGNFIATHGPDFWQDLIRVGENRSTDTAFKTAGVDGVVYSIFPLPTGQVLIAGSFTNIGSTTGMFTVRNGIARLYADGTLDHSFNPNATPNGTQGNVFRVLRLASGKLLVGGHFLGIGGTSRAKLARLNSNGSVDTTFNAGTMNVSDYVWNFVETPDGKILVCGGFTQIGNAAHNNVARLNADGSNDPSFTANVTYSTAAYPSVNTVLLQDNGSVVITGAFDRVNGTSHTNLARLGTDGTPDGFGTLATPNAAILCALQQPDGAIVIGGSFTSIAGLTAYSKLARITVAGTIDATFAPPSMTEGDVYTVLRQPDGRIFVGGSGNIFLSGRHLLRVYGAPLTPVRDVAQVSLGDSHKCLINTAGKTECWGDNSNNQLGNRPWVDFDPISHSVPGVPDGMLAVEAYGYGNCVLTANHGVRCWGDNFWYQIGDGSAVDRPDPTDVIGLSSGVSSVKVGQRHACAVMDDGSVRCWGHNTDGQLGDGSVTSRAAPVAVKGLGTTVQALALSSYHTCALTTAGGVLCWGYNGEGQLGNGTHYESIGPVVGLASGVTSIQVTDESTCALTAAGAVLCWGGGYTANSLVPLIVPTLAAGVVAIGAGYHHMCAITSAGALKCWGENKWGQLGSGGLTNSSSPVDVLGLSSGVRQVSGAWNRTCAVTDANALFCWGIGPVEVLRYAFRVTAGADGGGSISPAGAHLVDAGTQERFTITADTGYHLLGIDGNCGGALSGNLYTTSVIGSDCTLAAHFAYDLIFANGFGIGDDH